LRVGECNKRKLTVPSFIAIARPSRGGMTSHPKELTVKNPFSFVLSSRRHLAFSLFGSLAAATLASLATEGCGSAPTSSQATGAGGVRAWESNLAESDASAAGASCPARGAGTQILASNPGSLVVINPTADDRFLIYAVNVTTADGGSAADILALPLGGGKPRTILANASSAYVVVDESTVFVWSDTSPSTGVGTLTVWTEATGARLASTASAAYFSAASPDSKHVVFGTDMSADGSTGSLVSAETANPSAQTTLLADTVFYGATFRPSLGFQPSGQPNPGPPGFVSDAYFVTSHQETSSDTVTLSSWDTATWKRHDLLVGAQSNPQLALQNWNADARGERIAALTNAGQLEVIPVAGPACAAVPVGPATGTTTFALLGAGDGVVYGNPPAASQTAPQASMSTARLRERPRGGELVPSCFDGSDDGCRSRGGEIVGTGFGGFYFPWENGVLGPSPDGSSVLYFATESTSFGFLYSLSVVANAPSSTPVAIDPTYSATVPADPFTADSRFVIYGTNVDTSVGTMQLDVWDIAARKAIAVSAGATALSANAVARAGVLYNDAYDPSLGGPNGVADLKTVDVSSKTLAPLTIQAGADITYYLTPDRSHVIYTRTDTCNASEQGIYVYGLN
jgi:hypothetical protein